MSMQISSPGWQGSLNCTESAKESFRIMQGSTFLKSNLVWSLHSTDHDQCKTASFMLMLFNNINMSCGLLYPFCFIWNFEYSSNQTSFWFSWNQTLSDHYTLPTMISARMQVSCWCCSTISIYAVDFCVLFLSSEILNIPAIKQTFGFFVQNHWQESQQDFKKT